MSNITKHEGGGMILRDLDGIVRMGKIFAESGMFDGSKDVAKAIVKIQAGAELGIAPFQAMSGLHIISGKPTIGAGVMASMLDSHPDYEFEVTEHTNMVCEIKFFKKGKLKGTSRFTIGDAKRAGTKNLEKYPANMLYARAMSNGVKWYCPGLFSGPVYVPEEFEGAETIDAQHQEIHHEAEEKQPVANQADQATEAQTEEPATVKQKTELLLLLNNKVITGDEKSKMMENINALDHDRIEKAIDKIKKVIEKRTQPTPEATEEPEVVVHQNAEPKATAVPESLIKEEMIHKDQKGIIERLLSAPQVTKDERELMTESMKDFTKSMAESAIRKLQKTIKERRDANK